MIPKKIHYCWFGGHEMPPLQKACLQTWKKYLSGYEFVRWDETNAPMNDFVRYHLQQKNWAFVSDYVRLHALYTQGGIYLDTDFEVVKPFDTLLNNEGFLAWESDTYITNGIAGSKKEHVFFKDCMDYMLDRFEKDLEYHISPVVTTTVWRQNKYNLKIYEKNFFYPYNPYDSSRDIKILMYSMVTDDTYAIHHWAKSWELQGNKNNHRTGVCAFIKKCLSTVVIRKERR